MVMEMNLGNVLDKYGKKYSELLGLRLGMGTERELFRWFIASLLLGKRISETLALRTYKQLENDGLLSFDAMSKASWEELVESLDAGGYVRYDFSTASTLLEIMKTLGEQYGGTLNSVHETAKGPRDLETRLQEFRGFGPVTTNIFLRELRGLWEKADPPLGHLAKKAARELGIRDPEEFWRKNRNRVRDHDFVNFETALMRLGREARRKKCSVKNLLATK